MHDGKNIGPGIAKPGHKILTPQLLAVGSLVHLHHFLLCRNEDDTDIGNKSVVAKGEVGVGEGKIWSFRLVNANCYVQNG